MFGEPHQPTLEELAERKEQEVKMVRNALAEVFVNNSGFYRYMQTIDQDESGTVSAKEFLKLLMLISNISTGSNDAQASDLTIELATNCWYAILSCESKQHMCYNQNNKEEREVHFTSLKAWIFQRELTPNALRSWSVEVDAGSAAGGNDDTTKKTVTRFTSSKDVFVYLNTIDRIIVEQLGEGQYLVTNREDNHPFPLLEERSDFWCNLLCYPAHPLFFKVRKLFYVCF